VRRNRFRPELRVGGYLLSGIVRWDGLRHSGDINGDVDLSARIIFKNGWRHPALRDKAPVELMRGPTCLWAGTLVEPDWDAGTIAAVGASRDAETALALDPAMNASTKPNEVIDAAISRGALSWRRVGDFGTTDVGEAGSGLTTVRSVLDAWATKTGQSWHVDSRRRLIIIPAIETSINWLVAPGSGVLGVSGTERVDVVFVRYTNKTTGRRDTASYPSVSPTRPVEKPKEIFDRGPLLPAEAVAIATGLWNEANAGRAGWTNGLKLSAGQVTNLGGREADLAFVRAGQGMALRSVPDPRGLSRNTSIVLGDVEFDWAAGELQANPKGLAAQDEQSALDSVAELAASALAKAAGSPGDTGWIALTHSGTAGTLRYRVRGGVVFVDGNVTINIAAGATATIVTAANGLPAGTRPVSLNMNIARLSNNDTGIVLRGSDGSITVTNRSGSAATSVQFAYSYPID